MRPDGSLLGVPRNVEKQHQAGGRCKILHFATAPYLPGSQNGFCKVPPSGGKFYRSDAGMNLIIRLFFYFIIFLVGASVFSFLNVLAYRLPRGMNFLTGRSVCPECGEELRWYQMVPVASYLILGGKCGFCRCRIPFRYLASELLGGALAVLTALCFGWELSVMAMLRGLAVFAFLGVLYAVALIDGDTMEIPNGLVIAAGILGLIACLLFPEPALWERAVGVLSVSLPLLLISLAVEGAFGGGDIKLMAACGLFLGWKLNLVALFFALMGGGAYGVYLLAAKKKGRKDHFAFGPFLCAGAALSLFLGERVLSWYLGFFNF